MKNKFEIRFGNQIIIPEIGKFPGGEIRVRIIGSVQEEILIVALLFNSDDVMSLIMLVDAARGMGVRKIRLTMPYIPYARQDRVCNIGESFSIRVFSKLINSLGFASVLVFDPHSSVSVGEIDRCIVRNQWELMAEHNELYNWICRGGDTKPMYLVSPDKGATKKVLEIAKKFPQFDGIIYADKERDLFTGNIIRTVVKEVPKDINDAKLLVADDIIDGGRTFIELAKVLRPLCAEMSLYATHGILSQGIKVFEPYYSNVWSTITFSDYQ